MNKQTIKDRRVKKNGKNKIRRKNKRKSTIRRKMKGGAVRPIPPCDREHYLSIQDIWNSINRDNFEICGCAELDPTNRKYKLYQNGEGPPKPPAARRYCQLPFNYGIVWHTHPACCKMPSKLYPSVEDLLKVIKHGSSTSLIFCLYGVWIIECEEKITQTELISIIKEGLTPIVEHTIKTTNNGQVINSASLSYFIDTIFQGMQQYIPSYSITFNFWEGMDMENTQRFKEINPNTYFY